MENKIKIIHEPSSKLPYCIVYKPSGIPTAPLNDDDKNNAFAMSTEYFPELLQVNGLKSCEHGLVHRIDTQTSGLVLIAENQLFYDYILNEQKNGRVKKYYTAICINHFENPSLLQGFPDFSLEMHNKILNEKKFTISSYFRNYGCGNKEVRPVNEFSNKAALKKMGKSKLYSTNCKIINYDNDLIEFKCSITEGYRHQVRNHLAWAGFPISGDKLYNYLDKISLSENNKMHFFATGLEFFYDNELKKYEFDQDK